MDLETNAEAAEGAGGDISVTGQSEGTEGTYVTFDLAGETLGVEVRWVREILDRVAVKRLPNSPAGIEGVIDIRGESVPIVDMGTRLGLPRVEDGEDTRIIVFELKAGDDDRPIGVFADQVRDVTRIGEDQIEPPPDIADSGWNAEQMRGMARHGGLLILLLDLKRVFRMEDMTSDDISLETE